MNNDIRIIDVIAKPHMIGSKNIAYYVVLSRMPDWMYERNGNSFVAHDSGFYDFLEGGLGKGEAFAGRAFNIRLSDGSDFACEGRMWSCAPPEGVEPVVEIGIGTLETLDKCYVFSSASVARSKLDAWLAQHIASNNYYKYDKRESLDWLAEHRDFGSRPVCANRARKLRRRGVTVWRDGLGRRLWSPYYERRKRELLARKEADQGTVRLIGATGVHA